MIIRTLTELSHDRWAVQDGVAAAAVLKCMVEVFTQCRTPPYEQDSMYQAQHGCVERYRGVSVTNEGTSRPGMLTEHNAAVEYLERLLDMAAHNYDPFERGPYPAGVHTFETVDTARNCMFPCEIWYPAAPEYSGRDLAPETQDEFSVSPRPPHLQMSVRNARACSGTWPLIVFSHPSFFHRRSATYLCTHLASHGYVVAALDHSEVVSPELAWREGATEEETKARIDGIISSRVPDIRLLLERLLEAAPFDPDVTLDANRVGIVGHSAGGWTALATPDYESRVRAVVALAPAGASNPRPGILPMALSFEWKRDVPTLLLAAENDAALPLAGMYEIYQRIPATKRMVILRRADHAHFMDNVEREHESFRTALLPPVLKAIQQEMLPSAELTSGEKAHLFTRGLTTCHMETFLRERPEARRFLEGDIEDELAAHGVEARLEQ